MSINKQLIFSQYVQSSISSGIQIENSENALQLCDYDDVDDDNNDIANENIKRKINVIA